MIAALALCAALVPQQEAAAEYSQQVESLSALPAGCIADFLHDRNLAAPMARRLARDGIGVKNFDELYDCWPVGMAPRFDRDSLIEAALIACTLIEISDRSDSPLAARVRESMLQQILEARFEHPDLRGSHELLSAHLERIADRAVDESLLALAMEAGDAAMPALRILLRRPRSGTSLPRFEELVFDPDYRLDLRAELVSSLMRDEADWARARFEPILDTDELGSSEARARGALQRRYMAALDPEGDRLPFGRLKRLATATLAEPEAADAALLLWAVDPEPEDAPQIFEMALARLPETRDRILDRLARSPASSSLVSAFEFLIDSPESALRSVGRRCWQQVADAARASSRYSAELAKAESASDFQEEAEWTLALASIQEPAADVAIVAWLGRRADANYPFAERLVRTLANRRVAEELGSVLLRPGHPSAFLNRVAGLLAPASGRARAWGVDHYDAMDLGARLLLLNGMTRAIGPHAVWLADLVTDPDLDPMERAAALEALGGSPEANEILLLGIGNQLLLQNTPSPGEELPLEVALAFVGVASRSSSPGLHSCGASIQPPTVGTETRPERERTRSLFRAAAAGGLLDNPMAAGSPWLSQITQEAVIAASAYDPLHSLASPRTARAQMADLVAICQVWSVIPGGDVSLAELLEPADDGQVPSGPALAFLSLMAEQLPNTALRAASLYLDQVTPPTGAVGGEPTEGEVWALFGGLRAAAALGNRAATSGFLRRIDRYDRWAFRFSAEGLQAAFADQRMAASVLHGIDAFDAVDAYR